MTATATTRHYWCTLRDEPWSGEAYQHAKGYGKPPAKCEYCGGGISSMVGVLAVIAWRQDGRYQLDDAVKVFVRQKAAEAHCDALGDDYVVRFLATS